MSFGNAAFFLTSRYRFVYLGGCLMYVLVQKYSV